MNLGDPQAVEAQIISHLSLLKQFELHGIEFVNQKTEQPITVIIGVPTHLGAEEIPQRALENPWSWHYFLTPTKIPNISKALLWISMLLCIFGQLKQTNAHGEVQIRQRVSGHIYSHVRCGVGLSNYCLDWPFWDAGTFQLTADDADQRTY